MLKKIVSSVTISLVSVVSLAPVFAADTANDLFGASSTSTGNSVNSKTPTGWNNLVGAPSTSTVNSVNNSWASKTPTGWNDLFGASSTTSSPTSVWSTDPSSYAVSEYSNSSNVLDIKVEETKPGTFMVVWTLKAPSPISIKKAYITLKYDQSAFDISATAVKYSWEGLALPTPQGAVETKTDSTDPTMGLVTFSALSAWLFSNTPQGKPLFVAAFKQKEWATLTNKSYFTIDNKSSFILDSNEKQLLSEQAVSVPASPNLITTTPTSTTDTPPLVWNEVTTEMVETTDSGIPVLDSTATGSTADVNTDEAKNVKTWMFENTLIALALFLLGWVLLLKNKRKEDIL